MHRAPHVVLALEPFTTTRSVTITASATDPVSVSATVTATAADSVSATDSVPATATDSVAAAATIAKKGGDFLLPSPSPATRGRAGVGVVRIHARPCLTSDVSVSSRPSRPSRCAFCHDELAYDEGRACESCGTVLHRDCYWQLGRCPTLGCTRARPLSMGQAGHADMAVQADANAGTPREPLRLLWCLLASTSTNALAFGTTAAAVVAESPRWGKLKGWWPSVELAWRDTSPFLLPGLLWILHAVVVPTLIAARPARGSVGQRLITALVAVLCFESVLVLIAAGIGTWSSPSPDASLEASRNVWRLVAIFAGSFIPGFAAWIVGKLTEVENRLRTR